MALRSIPGLNWIAGGIAAALLVPALAIGLGMPFWIALGVAILAGGGCVVLLARRQPFEGLDANAIGRGKIELARELLLDADPLIERMEAVAEEIQTAPVRQRVGHLGNAARGIIETVEKDPLKIDRARRFLTYYLPRSVEMAEGYRQLEQQKLPDPARLQATGDMLDRLDEAFSKYADGLFDDDMDRLDIELKLLKGSLDEDLGPAASRATGATRPLRSA